MDLLSIIGIVLAFAALTAGAVMKGAGLHSLISSAALLIVVVGLLPVILLARVSRPAVPRLAS